MARKFLIWRRRRRSMAGSNAGPSTPQFQLRLSLWPSRLCFAVGLVVLGVVGDQVVEREAIVTGHKVDALVGFVFFQAIDIRAAKEAWRDDTRPSRDRS